MLCCIFGQVLVAVPCVGGSLYSLNSVNKSFEQWGCAGFMIGFRLFGVLDNNLAVGIDFLCWL
jgi:hypothetical protein